MELLKPLSRLRHLIINEDLTRIHGFRDIGMNVIGGFTELEELTLERNQVYTVGSVSLGNLKKLRSLSFCT